MKIERYFDLVEDILGARRSSLADDFEGYRNHVYRVINLCYLTGDYTGEERQKIQIAACFHDIGIWIQSTLDYLPPSIHAAQEYLLSVGKIEWSEEVSLMIERHHSIRSQAGLHLRLVEGFRRADIADFSLGLFCMDLPKKKITALKRAFPNNGFHKMLMTLGIRWFMKHPLNPLPMFRY